MSMVYDGGDKNNIPAGRDELVFEEESHYQPSSKKDLVGMLRER